MHKKMKRTWQRLTSDKRRFSLFCGLLFVGLLLWARIIVIARPARTAIAEPVIHTKFAAILSSDNIQIPVMLESIPEKNPFSVSAEIFPIHPAIGDQFVEKRLIVGPSGENEFIASLSLDAVMGDLVLINGNVIRVGEIVGPQSVSEPLRLVEVHGRTVILLAGDRRYELSIAPFHP
jgi:hypothetical protein